MKDGTSTVLSIIKRLIHSLKGDISIISSINSVYLYQHLLHSKLCGCLTGTQSRNSDIVKNENVTVHRPVTLKDTSRVQFEVLLTTDLSLKRGGTTLQCHDVLQRLCERWCLSRHDLWHPEPNQNVTVRPTSAEVQNKNVQLQIIWEDQQVHKKLTLWTRTSCP